MQTKEWIDQLKYKKVYNQLEEMFGRKYQSHQDKYP